MCRRPRGAAAAEDEDQAAVAGRSPGRRPRRIDARRLAKTVCLSQIYATCFRLCASKSPPASA